MPWDFVLLFLLLGVVVPWRGAVQMRRLFRRGVVTPRERVGVYVSTIIFQWTFALATFWRCSARGITPRMLGLALHDRGLTASVAAGLAAVLALNQIISLKRLARRPPEQRGIAGDMASKLFPQTKSESLLFVVLAATAALCEEFLYRGFAFTAIGAAFSNSFLWAAIGSSLLFSLAHSYQGRTGAAVTFLLGFVFAAARAWTESLAPPIAAHFLTDVLAGLAGPRLLKLSRGAVATAGADPAPPQERFGRD